MKNVFVFYRCTINTIWFCRSTTKKWILYFLQCTYNFVLVLFRFKTVSVQLIIIFHTLLKLFANVVPKKNCILSWAMFWVMATKFSNNCRCSAVIDTFLEKKRFHNQKLMLACPIHIDKMKENDTKITSYVELKNWNSFFLLLCKWHKTQWHCIYICSIKLFSVY